MEVGQRIRKIRELRGYSQEYMAQALAINQRTYSRIENNEIELSLGRLGQISQLLELEIHQIIAFDENQLFKTEASDHPSKKSVPSEMSKTEREQIMNYIKHLQGEINFLRKQLKKSSKQ